MQYLVVLDTNVIVSALLSKHPDASPSKPFIVTPNELLEIINK